jgi:pyridoxal phosphate enzyme (YggS family)
MGTIQDNIEGVRARVRKAAADAGRSPDEILLLAVAKSRSASEVRAAYDAGQRDFGENYLQEAIPKIEAMEGLDVVWHFIGAVQSNKTGAIAQHFQWVHTVDRLRIAERLGAQRPAELAPLNVCLQVNLDAEASKAGIAPDAVCELASHVAEIASLKLRGLMAIPAPREDFAEQCATFARLRGLFDEIAPVVASQDFDTLSMGMSDDFPAAVREGATIVRIGTAIFGPRDRGR